MKIKYLGTAAAEGWPGIFCNCEACLRAQKEGGKNLRTRSQTIIDDTLLVDFPPDSYFHMLHGGLHLPGIRDILITHTHQDHFYPDDLAFRCGGFASGVEGVLTLYGNDALKGKFDDYVTKSGWAESLLERLHCRELKEFEAAAVGGFLVTPLLARHDRREKCFLYLVEKEGKSLFYGNDTDDFPETTWSFLKDRKLDLVSLDCTMGKYAEGSNHMGIPDVIRTREKMLAMGCVRKNTVFVATHFSHNGNLLHNELENALQPCGFLVAYDSMEICF